MKAAFNMTELRYQAKDRLLGAMLNKQEELFKTGSVSDQMSAIYLEEEIEKVRALNRTQAFRLEKRIMKKEEYRPEEDKHGFGPVNVSPMNYAAFIQ